MLLGSLPMTYFVLIAKKRSFASVIENNQVNTFLKLVFWYILIISAFYAYTSDIPFVTAFRRASFNMISAMTTTGFSSYDFIQWGTWLSPFLHFIPARRLYGFDNRFN